LRKMAWTLGEDFEFEGILFQDVPREVERQEVWITLAALYQLMFLERRKSSFCRALVAQGKREVRLILPTVVRSIPR